MAAMGVTEEQILAALRQVHDPDLRRDIVSLGMVKDLVVHKRQDGARVSFTFELTTPACPLRSQLEAMARSAVAAIPGVKDVNIKMTSSVPAAGGRPLSGELLIPGVRNSIAVASGKGGVGKTTVSVNLAIALAQQGAQVGLLDADITGPNVPMMMGAKGMPRAEGQKLLPLERYGVKLMSIGFLMEEDTPVVWRGPLIAGAIRQFLADVRWGELDYLVIDLPPGTSDAALSTAQLIPLTGGVLVGTPQAVAMQDVRKQLYMFKAVKVPILGMIENMSYFLCPHCGERTHLFGSGGVREAAEEIGVPFLGEIPFEPNIRLGGDEGLPVVAANPGSPHAAAFHRIASQLAAQVSIVNLARRTGASPIGPDP